MKSRILLLSSLILALFSRSSVSFAAKMEYDDTAGHWAEHAIQRWSAETVVEGTQEQHFEPNRPLTRAELAKILAELFCLPSEPLDLSFENLPPDAWYTPYFLRCYAVGILPWDPEHAQLEEVLTRQEIAVLLVQLFGLEPPEELDFSVFPDISEAAEHAKPALAALAEANILRGVGDGRLAPAQTIDRASFLTLLDRTITQSIRKPGRYKLVESGLILVACGNVTLTGASNADLLLAPGAAGQTVTFQNANLTGTVSIQADDVNVLLQDSRAPNAKKIGQNIHISKVKEDKIDKTPHIHYWDSGVVSRPATCEHEGVLTFTCTICHTTQTAVIPALEHQKILGLSTEPTCTQPGEQQYVCSLCGILLETKVLPALEHQKVLGLSTEPTCTTPGEQQYVCSTCRILLETETIPALEHQKVPGLSTEPTCTQPGEQQYVCSLCGTLLETKTIPALEHQKTLSLSTEPTCTTPGEQQYVCSTCGILLETETIPALEHQKVLGLSTEPTCTQPGEQQYVCSICGTLLETEVFPALGHQKAFGLSTEPTCTQPGEQQYVCSLCGTLLETEVFPALGHQKALGLSTEPTCTQPGEQQYVCSLCGTLLETEAIPALEHQKVLVSNTKPTCSKPGEQRYSCARCGTQLPSISVPPTGIHLSNTYQYDLLYHWKICDDCGLEFGKSKHLFDENSRCTLCEHERPTGDALWRIYLSIGAGRGLYAVLSAPEGECYYLTFPVGALLMPDFWYAEPWLEYLIPFAEHGVGSTFHSVEVYSEDISSEPRILSLEESVQFLNSEESFPCPDVSVETDVSGFFTFSGLDFEHYTYFLTTTPAESSIPIYTTFTEATLELPEFSGQTAQLYAVYTTQTVDTFTVTRTQPVSLLIPAA